MNMEAALNIARRFITLPTAKRRLYLQKMYAENISPANLPVPEVKALFDCIPLSFAQQRQWFLWQLTPDSSAYNIPTALRLTGSLDHEALRHSFQTLIERHETLRTTFRQDDEQSIQIVHAAQPFVLSVERLPDGQTVEAWVEEEVRRPFDLEHGPLLRVKLLGLADDEHVLALTLHHIVSDGWSMPVLVDELVQLYEGYSQGHTDVSLPALPIQYADYAIWQRNWMEAGEQERQLAYWQEQLGGEQPVLELPADRPRPSVPDQHGARLEITLDAELVSELKALAQRQGGTLFMVLLASFQSLLQRYSGQNDIRIGVPVANRTRVETERLIGFFVNTQVLKATFELTTTFEQLLQQVRQAVLEAQTYQELPFEQLVEALQPDRSLSHSPLFQVMFNHQTQGKGSFREIQGLQVEGLSWEGVSAQFDLTLNTFEHDTGIGASLTYATALFDAPTIERLARHWKYLLQNVVKSFDKPLAELSLLSTDEYRQIVHEWNCTEVSYPAELCIHQLIELQVLKTPQTPALLFGEQSLSYAELNQRSNRLAHKLRELGVGPDVLVGIAVERSLEMVVGLLAILKAGGAYVPLDPEYPQERLAYMLEHSGARLLLTQQRLLDQLPVTDVQTLCLDRDVSPLDNYPVDNLGVVVHPEHPAYCIYTSGSTGKPKGVAVRHQALVNFLFSMADKPGLTADDRVLALTSLSFDIAGLELYLPLLVGACVVLLADRENQDPQALLKLIEQQSVTTVQATPSTWRMLLDAAAPEQLRQCRLLSGGEALAPDLANRLLERSEQVWNLYGPTETTIWSGLHCLDRQAPTPLLGMPIANTRLHIVEQGLGAAAPGVAGELLIGGDGLARGYLHRPDLTAERFVPDPFDTSEQGGGRLYRTGDLARYRAEGVIEYVSRIDHQVKIRGFRIELGEIEARLLEHEAVREAVVIDVDGPGGKQLAAYLVTAAGELDAQQHTQLRSDLREQLRINLPDYMVPAYLLFLDKLPLTPNGKLDRKALPKPDGSLQQQVYVAPQTELERQIAAIWAEVLKVEQVGLTDNFFELGGHSLIATQVISRVRQALNISLPLRTLFEAPELLDFIRQLSGSDGNAMPELFRADRGQPLKLSYAQQRQWFLWQLAPDSPAYNIPTALRLNGVLDSEALRRSIHTLIERHETLRTTFRQDDEQSIQIVHAAQPFVLSVERLPDGQTVEAWVEEEVRRPFDLEHGPLLRVKLLCLAADEHVLVLTLHHIVSDGWSMPVLVDELVQLYEGYSQGHTDVSLPALPIQYADYAIWQRNWMEAGEQERQLAYWQGQLGGEQPVLELPTDRPRPSVPDQHGARLDITLDAELVSGLKTLAQRQGGTLFMVLLASFQSVLQRYSGQNDIRVGVPTANRTRVETERLIGFFVNTQVLKATFELTTTFEQLLQQVRQTVMEAQTYQELPFEQLVEALQPDRSLSHSPLFQVMFNHQTQAKGSFKEIPGLQVEGLSWEGVSAQFDLTLNTFEHDTGIGASLTYATALFDTSTIERLGRHWINLLKQVVRQPQQRLCELSLLDAAEQQQIVHDWNRTEASYPGELCIHQLIEQQVARTPDGTALVFGEQSLSYTELNQQANRLAHKLRELGVGPDVLVGIAVERSLEMVVGLLAILKAGGAYVPLDPEYPQERLAYMLEHSGARLLLTQQRLLDQLPVTSVDTWCLDRDGSQLDNYSVDNLDIVVHPDHPAYCIYTSGSTGKPKGVAVRHQALVNFLFSMADKPGLTADDRVLALTSLSFDIAGLELYLPLLVGACVVLLADRENQDPQALLNLIEQQSVTTVQATPSTWRMLLDAAAPEQLRQCRLLSGGEALAPDLANRLLERSEQVWNLYGPTETTIWSGLHCLDRQAPTPLLGMPIANTRLHIVEQGLGTAAPGVAGELLIGGDGLARGYLHRPDLTAERFVPDPFDTSEQGGGRLYRTGDLARYRAEGVIEYVSRIDHQVKIRGFRIELGEIEARLLEHEAVREAVVIDVDGPSGKQLAAYVVPVDVAIKNDSARAAVLCDALRRHMKSRLADYMMPAHIIIMNDMPKTPNEKLDRKRLPAPETEREPLKGTLPRTRIERQLAAIWQEVLGREFIGLHDDFFELGGHSILMLSVLKKVREQIDERFAMHDFMRNPTLAKQAELLRDCMGGQTSSLIKLNSCPDDRHGIYCLPPAGGTTFPYYALAKELNAVCPVYGLLHKGFVEKGFHYQSWREMVEHYYDEIIKSQPSGPYHLLGWSSGGALAIEIAHLIEMKGEKVNLLALVDSMLPHELFLAHRRPSDVTTAPVDLAALDERNHAAVMIIRSFFPEKEDAYIMGKVQEGRAAGLQDDGLVKFMIHELLEGEAEHSARFKLIYDAYALEAEFSVGYDIYGNISTLAKDFELRSLQSRPEVWWSSISYTDIKALEDAIVNRCAVQGIAHSECLEVAHEEVIYAPVFLNNLTSRVLQYFPE